MFHVPFGSYHTEWSYKKDNERIRESGLMMVGWEEAVLSFNLGALIMQASVESGSSSMEHSWIACIKGTNCQQEGIQKSDIWKKKTHLWCSLPSGISMVVVADLLLEVRLWSSGMVGKMAPKFPCLSFVTSQQCLMELNTVCNQFMEDFLSSSIHSLVSLLAGCLEKRSDPSYFSHLVFDSFFNRKIVSMISFLRHISCCQMITVHFYL